LEIFTANRDEIGYEIKCTTYGRKNKTSNRRIKNAALIQACGNDKWSNSVGTIFNLWIGQRNEEVSED
jgi:hypothetical protein